MTATTSSTRQTARADSNAGRYDAPWDYTPRAGLLSPKLETHRFPAPIYLRADRVREERAFAQEALLASGRKTSRRIGAAAGAVLVLLAALGTIYLTGIGSSSSTSIGQIVAIETAVVVAVIAFVWLLRRDGTVHDELAQRARLYDVRLAELQHQAQRVAGKRA